MFFNIDSLSKSFDSGSLKDIDSELLDGMKKVNVFDLYVNFVKKKTLNKSVET